MINKLKELYKQNAEKILIGVIVLIVIAIAYNVFSPIVPNNSGGVDAIRSELDQVKQSQQSAINRLDKLEKGIADSADRVGRVSEGINNSSAKLSTIEQRIEVDQTRLATSAELITSCQHIAYEVRKRGPVGN